MDRLLSMRVFQKVISEGSFAGAARALEMSPAVVTRLVSDLEEHLGTRLLHRTTRRLSLSVAGEIYLGRVRTILDDIEEAHQVMNSQTANLAGELRVLAPPMIAADLIGRVVGEFRQRYPDISIDLEVASVDFASVKELPIEDYDVTLLPTSADFDGDIIARRIATTDAIIVSSPEYIAAHGAPEKPEQLIDHEVLRPKVPGQRRHIWRLFDSSNNDRPFDTPINPGVCANHHESLLRAVLAGAGITSVAINLVAPYLARGELIRILRPWITARLALYAALPSRKFIPERTHAFLNFLSEQISRYQLGYRGLQQSCIVPR